MANHLTRLWRSSLASQRAKRLQLRFERQIRFLENRLAPEGYLGLRLTFGALALIAGVWLFGAIAEDVVRNDPLTLMDRQVALWLHSHGTPQRTGWMLMATALASAHTIGLLTVLAALVLLRRRWWYRLLALALAVPGGLVLNLLLKSAFARDRPHFDDPIVTLHDFSFPSGHTMMATLFYGLLVVLAAVHIRSPLRRATIIAALCGVIFLVGFSRMYLGAHYLSDVLGAMTMGVAWLSLCVTAVDTMRRRREGLRRK
jgi:membrane-associated phospholipid phosphatase